MTLRCRLEYILSTIKFSFRECTPWTSITAGGCRGWKRCLVQWNKPVGSFGKCLVKCHRMCYLTPLPFLGKLLSRWGLWETAASTIRQCSILLWPLMPLTNWSCFQLHWCLQIPVDTAAATGPEASICILPPISPGAYADAWTHPNCAEDRASQRRHTW